MRCEPGRTGGGGGGARQRACPGRTQGGRNQKSAAVPPSSRRGRWPALTTASIHSSRWPEPPSRSQAVPLSRKRRSRLRRRRGHSQAPGISPFPTAGIPSGSEDGEHSHQKFETDENAVFSVTCFLSALNGRWGGGGQPVCGQWPFCCFLSHSDLSLLICKVGGEGG